MTRRYNARRQWVPWTLSVILVLACGCAALAQIDVSVKLLGAVTDPSGAVVPGVQVLAKNQQTGVESKTTADQAGRFQFPSLQPGLYTVTCEAAGFKRFVSNDIQLWSQQTVNLPVTLTVGTTTESIEVSAAANMVDTVTTTIQNTYGEKLMTALPIWGRDARATMELLQPGAVAAGTSSAENAPITSFNGMNGLTNNYRIDGGDFNYYYVGAATRMPAVENLAEFNVISSLPEASYGRAAGGQVTAVLKSGTNQLHGAAWGYFQNGAWNANRWENNWQGVPRDRGTRQWYGGNVGGPVFIPKLYNGKNKTFFFTSYERTSTSTTATSTGRTVSDAGAGRRFHQFSGRYSDH